jgi:hypothetical protein
MDERGREWRVMRFENSEGKYAEVGTYLGANTIPVPPGYKLVASTPMVPAEQLRGAVQALGEFRDGLTEALNAHGVPAMPSWREAIDWLAAHGGQS